MRSAIPRGAHFILVHCPNAATNTAAKENTYAIIQKPLAPFLLMILTDLIGLSLFLWRLAIRPGAQLADPGPLPQLQTQGIALFVAVATRHDDATVLSFTALVHKRDRANFHRHLDHVAVQRGWDPHRAGEDQSLVVPEADLQLLYEMEDDPIDWVRAHRADLNPVAPSADVAQLVNVTVRVKGELLSGALRGLAITLWVFAFFAGMHFLNRLAGDPDPPEDTTTDN